MWRSDDAKDVPEFITLALITQAHYANVIHPNNPDIVWWQALGHFGASHDRVFYKTVDGGKTWKKFYTVMT